MIEYLLILIILFVLLLVYFKIADKYNIIDKPNHRSAHTEITLRGGGIIYPISFIIFVIDQLINGNNLQKPHNFLIFGLGFLLICVISFLDDIMDLSRKLRITFHFVSVTLLLYFLDAFALFPIWCIPIFYVFIIGMLNAYNFMDGINGMSGLYSLLMLSTFLYINYNVVEFVNQDFIIYPLLASLVFLFFNFRKKAKCFMGDIGSIGIGFWLIALLGLLINKTNEYKYLLLFTVYGVEVVLTIIERLQLKENIFEAHRKHLYQLFANEKKVPHILISTFYSLVQLIINGVIILTNFSFLNSLIVIVIPSVISYLALKIIIKKQLLVNNF